jgi:hypothetical protein
MSRWNERTWALPDLGPFEDVGELAEPEVPGCTIVIEFERLRPVVRFTVASDEDRDRLQAWLSAHPQLLRLIGDALEVGAEE